MHQKIILGGLTVASASLFAASAAEARPFRVAQIPSSEFGCNTCHVAGGTSINPFGMAVDATLTAPKSGADVNWSLLCGADADADGANNEVELGDPSCVWTIGMAQLTTGTYNPGDATSTPPAMDAGVPDTGAADTGAADTGAADTGAADAGMADVGMTDAGTSTAADAGMVDMGATDAGTSTAADAGVAADAGTVAADAGTTGGGGDTTDDEEDDGCTCATPADSRGASLLALLPLAGLAFLRRRRR